MIRSTSIFKHTSQSDIIRIIIGASIFYVLLHFIRVGLLLNNVDASYFDQSILPYLQLPSSFAQFLHQPWSILTYPFVETNASTLFANLLWLWIFAAPIEDNLGFKRIIPLFFFNAIVGGLFFLITHLILASSTLHYYSGCIPCVLGIAVTSIFTFPTYHLISIGKFKIYNIIFFILFVSILFFLFLTHNIYMYCLLTGASINGYLSTTLFSTFLNKIQQKLLQLQQRFSNKQNQSSYTISKIKP